MTAKELARELGLSRDGVKRRLALLRQMGLDGWARVAPGGALDLPPEVVEVLRRARAFEQEGCTAAEALRRALGEAPNLAPKPQGAAPKPAPTGALDPALLRLLWVVAGVLGLGVAALWALVVVLIQSSARP